MKFALVNSTRMEAEPGLKAKCPACNQAMIAKCGEHRIWHWSHLGKRNCDSWWEQETEWHRSWKHFFPPHLQEVVHRTEDGEKHIADVKTDKGLVLEFQHSFLKKEECLSREAFYPNMIWIVNGLRRVHDRSRFFRNLGSARIVRADPLTFEFSSFDGPLFRDWGESQVPVYFDFGNATDVEDGGPFLEPLLWCLNPKKAHGRVLLTPVPKSNFLSACLHGSILKGIDYTPQLEQFGPQLEQFRKRMQALYFVANKSGCNRRSKSFRSYVAQKQRARSRARF